MLHREILPQNKELNRGTRGMGGEEAFNLKPLCVDERQCHESHVLMFVCELFEKQNIYVDNLSREISKY